MWSAVLKNAPQSLAELEKERKRLLAVEALDLFASESNPAYREAVYLAAMICKTPVSLVTVLGESRQHFQAKLGTDISDVPKDESFCVHAIRQRELFIVPDTLLDTRFCNLPLVSHAPRVRFYAGMPVFTPEGHAVGTLCVLDTVPRELAEDQKTALAILGRQVASLFQERQRVLSLEVTLTEKETIEKELRSSNALFQTFMDNSPLIGYMKDSSGRIIYYNRSFAQHFQISGQDWIGKTEYDVFPADVALKLSAIDNAILQNDQLSVLETSTPAPNGTITEWRTYKFAFVNASGDRFLAALCHEITTEKNAIHEVERYHLELLTANKKLLLLSWTDPLTGCCNRRRFDECFSEELASLDRRNPGLSVLLVDIDHFKTVNDTFGHDMGDRVLCHVAACLQQGVREADLVCRYGGEEFAILLPHTAADQALLLAGRLRLAVAETWDGCSVTISIGVATASPAVCDAATMLRKADEALYRAKASGRNRVILATEELPAKPASCAATIDPAFTPIR